VLGVPAAIRPFATTRLLSWRGKLRAAAEPFLPRTDPDDSLGALVRGRFGNEVHERLVDALVGSIYATDTDRSSLASVPQLAGLASRHRSLLLGARAARKQAPPPSPDSPIFGAPRDGMGALVARAATTVEAAGGRIVTGSPVATIEPDGTGWRVDDDHFDAVVLATPGRTTAPLLESAAPEAAAGLAEIEHSDVIMVRLTVAAADWPDRLRGRSGYLVPKPVQRHVTAASFASQKWSHWQPTDGSQLMRVSLGRDGLPIMHLDDDAAIQATVDETGTHLGIDLQPGEVSITRWPAAFPQYRPHHHDRVAAIDAALPTGIVLAGASYRGIGVPACIADGRRAAASVVDTVKESH
jgi:oxygen-dependent protoporphyrinogen oxidase